MSDYKYIHTKSILTQQYIHAHAHTQTLAKMKYIEMYAVKIPIKTTEFVHGIHITKIIIQNMDSVTRYNLIFRK